TGTPAGTVLFDGDVSKEISPDVLKRLKPTQEASEPLIAQIKSKHTETVQFCGTPNGPSAKVTFDSFYDPKEEVPVLYIKHVKAELIESNGWTTPPLTSVRVQQVSRMDKKKGKHAFVSVVTLKSEGASMCSKGESEIAQDITVYADNGTIEGAKDPSEPKRK
ncbi:MAG: hypothetical protein AAFX99_23445, partial [Myxococcota bacterium]